MRKINNQIIKNYLEANGKSAKAKLAIEADISVSFIEKLIGNNYNSSLKVDTAEKLASALGVTFDELLPIVKNNEVA